MVVAAIFKSKDDTLLLMKHSVITYTKIDLTNLMWCDSFRTESRSSSVLFYLGQKTTICLKFVAEKFIYNVGFTRIVKNKVFFFLIVR